MTSKAAIALALLIAASSGIYDARAEDFYKNKQLRLIAGFPAGNDYDLGARLLVKYLPKYIPGQPTIIVQNMPQAASVAAANYLYTQAPRDGDQTKPCERRFLRTSAGGLPGRPWYKHEIYAPGFYTGYAVKTLPAVREAIEQKKWGEVDADVSTVAQVLADEAALIDAAAAKLAPSKP